jgi:exopolysaccharide production protein ExoZ
MALAASVAAAPPAHLKLDSLQALRGIAAMMVVVYHTGTLYAVHTGQVLMGNVMRAGFAGVDVFFVLSGLVIFWVHGRDIGQPQQAGRFVVKRAFRLLPVYWVVVGLKLLKDPSALSGGALLATLLLLPTATPFINVSWTLSYELVFYFLFFLVIVLPRGWPSLLPLASMAMLALLPTPDVGANAFVGYLLRFIFNPHLAEFLFGVAVGWALRRYGAPSVKICAGLALVGLLAFLAAAAVGTVWSMSLTTQAGFTAYEVAELHSNAIFTHAVWWLGLPAALVIAGVVGLELQGRLRMPWRGPLVWVGDLSYSLYLTHGFVVHGLLSWAFFRSVATDHPAVLLLAWLGTLLLARVFYQFIEVPAMELGRRLTAKKLATSSGP